MVTHFLFLDGNYLSLFFFLLSINNKRKHQKPFCLLTHVPGVYSHQLRVGKTTLFFYRSRCIKSFHTHITWWLLQAWPRSLEVLQNQSESTNHSRCSYWDNEHRSFHFLSSRIHHQIDISWGVLLSSLPQMKIHLD